MSDDFGAKDWGEQFQKLWSPLGVPIPELGQPTIDTCRYLEKNYRIKASRKLVKNERWHG